MNNLQLLMSTSAQSVPVTEDFIYVRYSDAVIMKSTFTWWLADVWTAINSVNSQFPAISKDWTKIVYTNKSDWEKLYIKNVNDTWNWTQLTSVPWYFPCFSNDWKKVAFQNPSTWFLYSVDVNTLAVWQYTTTYSTNPIYSLDDLELFYIWTDSKIYKKSTSDILAWTAITTVSAQQDWQMDLSPDWTKIVYSNQSDRCLYEKSTSLDNWIKVTTNQSYYWGCYTRDWTWIFYVNLTNNTQLFLKPSWVLDNWYVVIDVVYTWTRWIPRCFPL